MPLLFIYLMQFIYIDLHKIVRRTLYQLQLAAIDSNTNTINYGAGNIQLLPELLIQAKMTKSKTKNSVKY